MDVASVPVTPEPAVGVVPAGTVRAGHAVAHAPVQLVPAAKVYRAIPALFTRMVPALVLAVFTVELAEVVPGEAAAPELPVFAAVDVVALLVLEDPQAARTIAAAPSTASAVARRTRLLERPAASLPRRRSVISVSVGPAHGYEREGPAVHRPSTRRLNRCRDKMARESRPTRWRNSWAVRFATEHRGMPSCSTSGLPQSKPPGIASQRE
jgi:hypothetical protein